MLLGLLFRSHQITASFNKSNEMHLLQLKAAERREEERHSNTVHSVDKDSSKKLDASEGQTPLTQHTQQGKQLSISSKE